MKILENLNKNQKEAVIHTEGPLLILAGAGSGKTRVITHRIAYLIKEKHVPPYKIFAVTFTNKAAQEMKNRVVNLIGPEGKSVFIKTFHAAAVFILRRFGDRLGIPSSFTIYDQSDQAAVIKDILIKMRLDPKKIKPSMIVSKISEIKDKAELIEGADPASLANDKFYFDFLEIYREYHRILASQNALDFNDLLIKTVELLRTSPEALSDLQRRWNYFMIDEYQDTNYSQYLISKYLAADSKNICVVGDDDQSIYSWRGADIRNILNFEKDYLNTAVITLGENYRSSEQILNAASCIIKNNKQRKVKELNSTRGEGEPVTWCSANNEYGEAEFVINSIISLKNTEGLKNSDFSIFYRTNAQSRLFEDQLRKENIPYRVIGGLKFYDRKEIKDLVAYLKFIVNPVDLISLLRIINTPSRGIGKATVEKIRETAQSENIPEWKVIENGLLKERVPKGIETFKKIILKLQSMAAEVPSVKLSDIVSSVLELSGYKKSLTEENTIESNSRLENINEFINSIFDYEIVNPEATMDQFLQDISLFSSEENPEEDPDNKNNSITLMTVHTSKGLEFPVVYLTGMEEDTFPHKFSTDTEEGIEEERRLCYVGITRAMERIFLTSAELRRTFHEVFYKEPSRFIFEIPRDCIETKNYFTEGFNSERISRNSSFIKDKLNDIGIQDEDKTGIQTEEEEISDSKFKLRDNVMHPKYGMGRVIKIDGKGDNLKLTILFSSSRKTFLEKYTPLERLS